MVVFHEVSELPEGFARLRDASLAEGFHMLERLEQRYGQGRRFDGRGEGLFAAGDGSRLLGIAGLCIDPYLADPRVGRVRHVYVAPEGRRHGIGRELVTRVIARSARSFTRLRLRTLEDPADRFYRALGFHPVEEADATHVLEATDLTRR